MLYDPKWEKPADVFSVESLIAWLEKQPANASYVYTCNGHCLMAQYFGAMGFQNAHATSREIRHSAGRFNLPSDFNDIAIGIPDLRTFGAALGRARMFAEK